MYPRHCVAVVCLRFSLNAARPGTRRGLPGLVCRGGGLGASSAGRGVFRAWSAGAVARRKYYIFFSWMKRNKNHGSASFLTGKSQTADSRLQTRLGAWWVKGMQGIAWCWVFKLVGRIGSNNVSAPLRGRRLPAIFPKRCKAGGRAGSSGRGLPGRGLGASVAGRLVSECRSLGLPGGGRKAAVPLGDTAWSSTSTSTLALALAGSAGAGSWGERCRTVGLGVPVAWSARRRSQSGRAPG